MTKCYLLRHAAYALPEGADPDYQHFAGCPNYGLNKHNLDLARTFKSPAAAKATNEFKHWGYEVVEANITITLA